MVKKLQEDYQILRAPSPYRIGPAPGFVQDSGPEMNRQYFIRRSEEENTYNVKQASLGNLAGTAPLFTDIFTKVAQLRNVVVDQKRLPLLTPEQQADLDRLIKLLDKVVILLTKDALDILDRLTVDYDDKTQP